MHAVVITEPGEPEVLRWLEVPDPVPGPGEVVIDIAAGGVNRADLMQRQGLYPPPPGAPPYPGLECSGRIRAVGEGVTDWRPGDEVCALLAGGGYAEQVAVAASQLLHRPDGLDLVTADFRIRDLLDWLRSPFALSGAPQRLALSRLEKHSAPRSSTSRTRR